jgi:hypothetical protein
LDWPHRGQSEASQKFVNGRLTPHGRASVPRTRSSREGCRKVWRTSGH